MEDSQQEVLKMDGSHEVVSHEVVSREVHYSKMDNSEKAMLSRMQSRTACDTATAAVAHAEVIFQNAQCITSMALEVASHAIRKREQALGRVKLLERNISKLYPAILQTDLDPHANDESEQRTATTLAEDKVLADEYDGAMPTENDILMTDENSHATTNSSDGGGGMTAFRGSTDRCVNCYDHRIYGAAIASLRCKLEIAQSTLTSAEIDEASAVLRLQECNVRETLALQEWIRKAEAEGMRDQLPG